MRLARIALAAAFCAGVALSATPAGAQTRLNGTFQVTDSTNNDYFTVIDLDGQLFDANGIVSTVNTANQDLVEISFFEPMPTDVSANDVKMRVRQKKFAQLYFFVDSDDPARDTDQLVTTVEKCDVDASANMTKGSGKVTVTCSDPQFWAPFSTTQVDAIQEAYKGNPRVKVKVGSDLLKGGVTITIKGDAFAD